MMQSAGAPRRLIMVLALSLLALSAGCRQVLYSQLSEHEANEMLAVLAQAGIEAQKIVNEKHWGVEVGRSDLPTAIQVLTRDGLPRSRYTSMAELFKRDSIVSTPTEERVRFIHGVSQELAKTLSLIEGVVAARVHIVLPQNDPLAERSKPSSASVFIRHRPDADLQRELTAIRSLVIRSVEGLTHDSVFVSLFTTDLTAGTATNAVVRPTVPLVPLTARGLTGMPALIGLLVVLVVMLLSALLVVLLRPDVLRRLRRRLGVSARRYPPQALTHPR